MVRVKGREESRWLPSTLSRPLTRSVTAVMDVDLPSQEAMRIALQVEQSKEKDNILVLAMLRLN